jgi:hypothetical protein
MSDNNSGDQTLDFKQEFLRDEIVDKNYDPEAFLAYFAQYDHDHGEDLDLDYVHMDELKKIVVNFQEYINSGKTPKRISKKVNDEKQEDNNILDKEQIESNFEKSVLNNEIDIIEETEIEEMLLCQKIDKSPLTGIKHINIEIGEPTIIKGGLFQSSYAVYSINCKDLGSEVIRRYRDFEWFRNELKHQFPGIYVRNFYINLYS